MTASRGSKAQDETSQNHIGGFPLLSAEEPWSECGHCDAAMSFLLQVSPGADHPWAGRTLALFECTSCPDETPDEFITPGPRDLSWEEARSRGIRVTEDYLAGNRTHQRVVVGDLATTTERRDIPEHVSYQLLKQREVAEPYLGLKVGGVPSWDENNVIFEEATYGNAGVVFLFQIPPLYTFARLPSAPRQQYLPGVWDDDEYLVFSGRPAFCFGTIDRAEPAAFLLSASDMARNVKATP